MPLITIEGTDTQAASRGVINGNFAYLAGLISALTGGSLGYTGTPSVIAVGPSPFTYTAGAGLEFVYISGGSVTSVTRRTIDLGNSMPMTVILPPGEAVVVTYDTESPPASPPEGRPLMTVDK